MYLSRFSDIVPGLNDTAENLLDSIQKNAAEISPSTIFAVASILEGVSVDLKKVISEKENKSYL